MPASWNHYPYNNSNNYTNRPYQQQVAPTYNVEEANSRNQQSQRMGYAAALANASRSGSGTIASSSSSVHSMESAPGYLSPVNSSSSRMDDLNQGSQSRSKNSLSDRSLFDPNKPSNNNNSNNGSNGGPYQQGSRGDDGARRHSINKSLSAAGLIESRPGLDPMRSGSNNSSMSSLNPEVGRRVSSTTTSTSPTDSNRRVTPPSHPSLPARPDWAIPVRSRPVIDPTKDDSSNHKVPM